MGVFFDVDEGCEGLCIRGVYWREHYADGEVALDGRILSVCFRLFLHCCWSMSGGSMDVDVDEDEGCAVRAGSRDLTFTED